MAEIEQRKLEERSFHDQLRGLSASDPEYGFYTLNRKFYSITRSSEAFVRQWLTRRCPGRRVLDYGCGDGKNSFLCVEHGAEAVGIDISDVSVRNASREAARRGIADRARFLVRDCEATGFSEGEFDLICVSGVLHHLDLRRAFAELARILRPEGEVICAEPLAHNPVFQLYRRMTPHLRTTWEVDHLIRRRDLTLARHYFDHVEARCFHLAALAAVPLRSTSIFATLLSLLETLDGVVLRLPVVKWLAWQVVFTLSRPRRPVRTGVPAGPP